MKSLNALIASDLSKDSIHTIKYAARDLLTETDSITLLCVEAIYPIPAYPYLATPEQQESVVEYAKKRLDKSAEEYLTNFKVKKRVTLSLNTAENICKVAEEENATAIIMGSHGAGAVANLFIGSTVQRVIKQAKCPVIVVPVSIALD